MADKKILFCLIRYKFGTEQEGIAYLFRIVPSFFTKMSAK